MTLKTYLAILLGFFLISYKGQARSLFGSFRLISGTFVYDSEALSGASATIASPSLMLHTTITEKHLIGVNTEIHFNNTTGTTSLYAFGANYRYYFHGVGSYLETNTPELSIKTKTKWSSFFNVAINKYTYFLGKNKVDETRFDQNGSFFNFDLGVGTEYDISSDFRIFTDLNYTLLSFASSDDRVKFKGVLFSVGIMKEF